MHIPKAVYSTIYQIDFNELYDEGYRFILCDLDNTIISYNEFVAPKKFIELIKKIKSLGMKFYIISNNNKDRISEFIESVDSGFVDGFLHHANKPLTYKTTKFVKNKLIDLGRTIAIGDQIATDLTCFARCGLQVILVSSIDRSREKWYTKINRLREKSYLKKLAETNPIVYQQFLANYYYKAEDFND